MATYELNAKEAEAVEWIRKTPAAKYAAMQAKAAAAQLAKFNAMTVEEQAAETQRVADVAADQARFRALPPVEKRAEMLLKRQANLAAEQETITTSLADPAVVAVVVKVQTDIDARVKPIIMRG